MYAKACHIPLQQPVVEVSPKGPVKKQVRFNLDDDLGDDPLLPTHLATFLEGNAGNEQDNAPSPSPPLIVDPPQPPCDEGHQCHPTCSGGAQPKFTAKPMAAVQAKS